MFIGIKKNMLQRRLNGIRVNKPFDMEEKERFVLQTGELQLLLNSYLFCAHTSAGEDLVIRITQHGGGENELLLILRATDGRMFHQEQNVYSIETLPLQLSCEEAGKTWRCTFNGGLLDETGKRYQVAINALFTATLPIYDLVHSPNEHPGLTTTFARAGWGSIRQLDFTKNQHYEQQGRMSGEICIDGTVQTMTDWSAIRNHCMGELAGRLDCHLRVAVTTEEGDSLMVSLLSGWGVNSLYVGFHTVRGKRKYATLTGYRLMNYDHCLNNGPERIKIYTEWSDGRVFIIEGTREANVVVTSADGQYKVNEGLGKLRINNLPAYGLFEYGFHTVAGPCPDYMLHDEG